MTGKQLRIKRATLDLTQAQLGELLDIKSNTISRYESENLKIPKAVELALETIARNVEAENEQEQVAK